MEIKCKKKENVWAHELQGNHSNGVYGSETSNSIQKLMNSQVVPETSVGLVSKNLPYWTDINMYGKKN